MSLRGEVWSHKTILTPSLYIEVPVPSQESELSCICVVGVSLLPLSMIYLLDFGTVPTVFAFCCFHFIFTFMLAGLLYYVIEIFCSI